MCDRWSLSKVHKPRLYGRQPHFHTRPGAQPPAAAEKMVVHIVCALRYRLANRGELILHAGLRVAVLGSVHPRRLLPVEVAVSPPE